MALAPHNLCSIKYLSENSSIFYYNTVHVNQTQPERVLHFTKAAHVHLDLVTTETTLAIQKSHTQSNKSWGRSHGRVRRFALVMTSSMTCMTPLVAIRSHCRILELLMYVPSFLVFPIGKTSPERARTFWESNQLDRITPAQQTESEIIRSKKHVIDLYQQSIFTFTCLEAYRCMFEYEYKDYFSMKKGTIKH
jgi:hypothetical protein